MPVTRKRSPGGQLVRLLWRIPLYSLGAAVFFGTLFGATWRHYRFAYWLSLVFSVCIMLAVWGTEHFLVPALHRAFPRWRSPIQEGLVYMVISLAGSATAAVIIHHTLLPGFLGGVRQVAVVVMYSLLFGALFTAVAMVWEFHRRSIDHARRDKELELARTIQSGFLPSIFPPSPRMEVHAVNVPSRGVSGDFYDVVPVGSALLLAIADVEGKSMAAALLSTALQASLRTQTPWVGSVAPMVANINVFVCQRHGTAQFATFFLARVDEGAHLTFCNAGHNPPLLLRADGSQLTLDCGGPMLGVVEGAGYEEEALDLRAGDRLVFYTDGITEAANPAGEEFQVERLAALVRAIDSAVPAREVTERILKAVSDFTEGADPTDDQTLIVVRVRE